MRTPPSGDDRPHDCRVTPVADGASANADSRLLTETIELMFFAYRDFTGEADVALAAKGFGRAHHRVIYFVTRYPGLPVADLLDILKITKQSLARVLRQLVEGGYVDQLPGATDRRQRLLYATERGAELSRALTALQMRRVDAALASAGPGAGETVRRFLSGMITETDRDHIEALLTSGGSRSMIPADAAPVEPAPHWSGERHEQEGTV